VAKRTLDVMQNRYHTLTETQQHDLERAAAKEQAKANLSQDPIEKYRAKRAAAFLDLEALKLKEERELASTPSLSLPEQKMLADQEEEEFANLRSLVEGGRSNSLVGMRLTNSYRRLTSERETIFNRELAQATALLTRYEDALTDAEIDLVNDSREERRELEMLLERLPQWRHPEALTLHESLETKHHALLEERRRVLQKLVHRADATRQQVLRRIQLLDDQHAYIRTHIFWVRDAAPVSPVLVQQCRRDLSGLVRALVAIVAEQRTRDVRGSPSAPYLAALAVLVALPLLLLRIQRLLRRSLARLDRSAGAVASAVNS
jgi:hypothetical protein